MSANSYLHNTWVTVVLYVMAGWKGDVHYLLDPLFNIATGINTAID